MPSRRHASDSSPQLVRVRCSHCDWHQTYGPGEMLDTLRGLGCFRREARPDVAEVHALFVAYLPRVSCKSCRGCGLQITTSGSEDEAAEWGDARCCQGCGTPILPERLEVFPNTQYCASCQETAESSGGATDFCSRCGNPVEVRQTGGIGITRYVATCTVCGNRESG